MIAASLMRVRGARWLDVRVAAEFDELDRGAEQRGGFFASGGALRGRAVRAGLAARADDEMRRAAGLGFSRAMTPPQPNSMSSGCAPKASSGAGQAGISV
jgi:hypothetical protein